MEQPALSARARLQQKPAQRPVMYQQWSDLLFLHWEMGVDTIASTLPPGLHPDTHEGKAYLGIVPFFMKNIRPAYLPAVPGISNFLEVNLRTYVYDRQGRPGVWFYSLDANQWLAVLLGRKWFNLPYHRALMRASQPKGSEIIHYQSTRKTADKGLTSRFSYQQAGQITQAAPGTLEFFLLERYLLYAYDQGKKQLYAGRVHHEPYHFASANVKNWDYHLLHLQGFPKPGREPDHAVVSPGVKVAFYGMEKCVANPVITIL
jgi:uncharacterized protein YqjF (DUF2071 family)